MERKQRRFFTKNVMISDLKNLREDLTKNQMCVTEIREKYRIFFDYKIFYYLVLNGYIKHTKTINYRKFYRWNFDIKLSFDLFDLLFENVKEYRKGFKEMYRNRLNRLNSVEIKTKPIDDIDLEGIDISKKGGAMILAKEIRKDGETWRQSLKRANEIIKTKNPQLKVTQKSKVEKTQKSKDEETSIVEISKEEFMLAEVESSFKVDLTEYLIIEKSNYLMLMEKLDYQKNDQFIISSLEIKINDLQNQLSQPKDNLVIAEDVKSKEKLPKYLKLFGIKIYEKN